MRHVMPSLAIHNNTNINIICSFVLFVIHIISSAMPCHMFEFEFEFLFIYFLRIINILITSSVGGTGDVLPDFLFLLYFPCSADHERDWPPC